MISAITIFTIITGTCSLLGFLYIFFTNKTSYKKLCYVGFVLALAWSLYILFYPTHVTENVANKVEYYQEPNIEQINRNLIIQRGSFSVSGFNPTSVEFPHPFNEAPIVEIINYNGYQESLVPTVEKVTPHQVIFKKNSVSGLEIFQNYRWVARGQPLKLAED